MSAIQASLSRPAMGRREAPLAAAGLVAVAVVHLIDGPGTLSDQAYIGVLGSTDDIGDWSQTLGVINVAVELLVLGAVAVGLSGRRLLVLQRHEPERSCA